MATGTRHHRSDEWCPLNSPPLARSLTQSPSVRRLLETQSRQRVARPIREVPQFRLGAGVSFRNNCAVSGQAGLESDLGLADAESSDRRHMGDSTHQLQDDAALDAQVAELSKDLATDAQAVSGVASTKSAATKTDEISELDDALFAAAPAVNAGELEAETESDHNDSAFVSPEAAAITTPKVVASTASVAATASAAPAAAANAPATQDEESQNIDSLLTEVSDELSKAADDVEAVKAAASAANLVAEPAVAEPTTPAPIASANTTVDESAPSAVSVATIPAEAVASTNAADDAAHDALAAPQESTPPAKEPTIEALDTHLAETAAEVLAEAERQRAEADAQEKSKSDAAPATPAETHEDDAAFASVEQVAATTAGAPVAAAAMAATASPATGSPTTPAAKAEEKTPAAAAAASPSPVGASPTKATASTPAAASTPPATQPASTKAAPLPTATPNTAKVASTQSPAPKVPAIPRVPASVRIQAVLAKALSPLVLVTDKIPTKLRHTLGLVGLTLLFNGVVFWAFLLLRDNSGALPDSKSTVPFLRPGETAPHTEADHGAADGHGAADNHETKGDGHGTSAEPKKKDDHGAADGHGKKSDGHGAADSHGKKSDGHGASSAGAKREKSTVASREARKKAAKAGKTASADSHGGGGGHH